MNLNLIIPSEIVVGIVAAIVFILLGDYFGYKFGRARLLTVCGFTVLGVIIIFAIYAIVYAFAR